MCSAELREEIQYWRIIFKRDEMERKFQRQELLYRSTAHLYFAACLGIWAIFVMIYEIIISQQSHEKPPKFYIFYSICSLFTFIYILLNRFWPSLYTAWHWLFVCAYSLNIAWSVYDADFIEFDNKKTFSYGLYSAILICCYVDGGTFIPKVLLNTLLITLFVVSDSCTTTGYVQPRNILRSLLPIALIAIKIRHEEFIKREMFLEKSKLEDMMSIIKNQIPLPFIIAKLNKRESKMNFHFGNLQAERQLGIYNQTTYETFMDNCFLIKQKSPHHSQNQQLDQTQSHLTQTDQYNHNNNHLPSLASSQLPLNIHPDHPNHNFLHETHSQHAFAPQESGNSLRCLIRRKVENLLLSTKNSKNAAPPSENNNNNNQQHQIKLQQQSKEQQQQQNQKNNCSMNNSSTATNMIKDYSILAPLNTLDKPKIFTQQSTEQARTNTSMTLPSSYSNQHTRGILLDKKRARIQSLHGQSSQNPVPRRVSISGQTQSLPTNNTICQNPIQNNEKSIILEEDELATRAQILPANQNSIIEIENTLPNHTEDIKRPTFLNFDSSSPFENIDNIFTLEPNTCSNSNKNNNNNSKNSSIDNNNNNNSNSTVIFTEGEIQIESIQVSEFASTSPGVNTIYQNETYQLFKPSQLKPTQNHPAVAAASAHHQLCQDKSEEQQLHPLRKVSAPRPPHQYKLSASSFIRFSPQTQVTNQSSSDALSPLGIRPKTSTFIFPPTPQTFASTITDRRSPFGAPTNASNTSTSHLILEKHKSSNSDMSYVNNFGVSSQAVPHLQTSPKRKKKAPTKPSGTATTTATATTSGAYSHNPSDNEGEEKVDVEHSKQDKGQSAPTRYAVKYRMFRSNEIFVAIIIENESYKKKYKHEKLKNQLLSDIRSHQHCLVQKSLSQVSSILDQLAASNPPPQLLDQSNSECPTNNNAHTIEKQTLFQHSQSLTELLACLLSMNLLHHTFILFNSFITKSFPSVTSTPSQSIDRIDLSQLIRSIASSLCCEARVIDKIQLASSQKYIIQQNAFLLKVLVFTIFRYLVQNSKPMNSKLIVHISSNEEDSNHKDMWSSKDDCAKQASDRENNENSHNNNTKNQNQSQTEDETEQYIRISVKLPFNEKLFNILQSKDLFVFSFDSLLKDELSGDALRQSMWIIRTSCQIVSLLGPFAKLLITKDLQSDSMTVSFLIYKNLNVISAVVAPASSQQASMSQILKPLSSRYEKKKQQERKVEVTASTQKVMTPFVNNCAIQIQMKPSFELTQQFSQEFR